MDTDKNGCITFDELYEALKNGQPNCQFNRDTVQLILEKCDENRDDKISFNEFKELYMHINEQFNDFLDIDTDFSGSIESSELAKFFKQKGYQFSYNFYKHILDIVLVNSGNNAITFDYYLKLRARFDQLNNEFSNSNFNNKENYFVANFFKKF